MSELTHDGTHETHETDETYETPETRAMTDTDALRLAEDLVGQAVQETEARCRVLAQFIDACERAGSTTSAWSQAVLELGALHKRRSGLIARRELIRQALDCVVGESPATAQLPLPPMPRAAAVRPRQVQVQLRRR